MSDLYRILNRHQAFCQISRGRWQLGKQDANLSGLALPPRPALDHRVGDQLSDDAFVLAWTSTDSGGLARRRS
jgi:hypothetical protein